MQASKLIATLLCVSTLAGCAQMGAGNLGGGSYERAEARRVMSVRMGIVEGVRPVKLEGSSSGVGKPQSWKTKPMVSCEPAGRR